MTRAALGRLSLLHTSLLGAELLHATDDLALAESAVLELWSPPHGDAVVYLEQPHPDRTAGACAPDRATVGTSRPSGTNSDRMSTPDENGTRPPAENGTGGGGSALPGHGLLPAQRPTITGSARFVASWNAASLRWEFHSMWLSAHFGTLGDRSMWVPASQTTFTGRHLGHPYVEIARRKHANYYNATKCVDPAFTTEVCDNGATPLFAFRFPVHADRNAGSRFKNGCVRSTDPSRATFGRLECFFTPSSFRGWESPNRWFGPAPAPYSDMLISERFEKYAQAGMPDDWGPGQAQPVIDGPTQLVPGEFGNWTISWIKGLNYCRWFVDDVIVQQGSCTYGRSFADAQTTIHRLRGEVEDVTGEALATPQFEVTVYVGGHQVPTDAY